MLVQTKDGQSLCPRNVPLAWSGLTFFTGHAHSKARNVKGPNRRTEKVCINISQWMVWSCALSNAPFGHYRSVDFIWDVRTDDDKRRKKFVNLNYFRTKWSPGAGNIYEPVNWHKIKPQALVRIKIEEAFNQEDASRTAIYDPEGQRLPVWGWRHFVRPKKWRRQSKIRSKTQDFGLNDQSKWPTDFFSIKTTSFNDIVQIWLVKPGSPSGHGCHIYFSFKFSPLLTKSS